MKKKVFLVIIGAICVAGVLFLAFSGVFRGNSGNSSSSGKIVTTNFAGYDFARAVTGDADAVEMLLKPGADAHSFEPTPEDIAKIRSAKLFIYVGGESDEWVAELLRDNEIPEGKTLRLMDLVDVKTEETVEGMEDEDGDNVDDVEYDEHIWTSPVNAIKLVSGIADALSKLEPEQAETYTHSAEEYSAKLAEIDAEFRRIVAAGTKKELIFGDRFPFRYFADEYGLAYYAAFPGCAEQTEASSKTVAFLIDKARADDVKVILKIELSSDKLARTIAEAVDAEVLTLNAAHNISAADFASGQTYADIMSANLQVLEKALK